MDMVEERIDQVSVIQLIGRLDASEAPALKEKVDAIVARGGSKLLIDLQQVDFVDSSGLGTLVGCLKAMQKAEGVLKISSLQDHPLQLFETMRLTRVFDLYDSREEALKAF